MKTQDAMKKTLTAALTATSDDTTLYQKSGSYGARRGVVGEHVVTEINGVVETTNTVGPDEVVLRGPAGELYVVSEAKFRDRYEAEGLDIPENFLPFKAKGMIRAVEYIGDSFEFMASWGEKMICDSGDYLACPVKSKADFIVTEVYRIERSVFAQTYARVTV